MQIWSAACLVVAGLVGVSEGASLRKLCAKQCPAVVRACRDTGAAKKECKRLTKRCRTEGLSVCPSTVRSRSADIVVFRGSRILAHVTATVEPYDIRVDIEGLEDGFFTCHNTWHIVQDGRQFRLLTRDPIAGDYARIMPEVCDTVLPGVTLTGRITQWPGWFNINNGFQVEIEGTILDVF